MGSVANENQRELRVFLRSCLIMYSFWNRDNGRGGTRRGNGGTITQEPNDYAGDKSLRAAGGAEKSQQCPSTFFNAVHLLPKTLGSNMGTPNLFLAPGGI